MKGKGIGVILLLMTLGGVFFIFNPSTTVWFPKCPFLVLTGYRCPGSGSQRAVHSLLHLDFIQAFSFNALQDLSLLFILLLICAEFYRTRKPLFYAHVHRPLFVWIYFIIVVAWGICRNIFHI